jgi:hypothetical protein
VDASKKDPSGNKAGWVLFLGPIYGDHHLAIRILNVTKLITIDAALIVMVALYILVIFIRSAPL